MKKTLLITLALGLAGAPSLVAGNIDVYITGSTAFRANVYTACSKLFSNAPSIFYGDAAHGGDANFNSKTASWAMTGLPTNTITAFAGNTLTIHGLFTGSIQGLQTAEQGTLLTFAAASGANGGAANAYVTNAPTIGFSDASGVVSPYAATGNFLEENVCIQPFVMTKSAANGGPVTNINNVTWEQLEYGIPAGRIPLSAWTAKIADTNKFIYLVERTADSGTRRTETQGAYYSYGDTVGVYIYDYTNNFFYPATNSPDSTASRGAFPNTVVGPAGLNNANLNWGPGYVGGGDIATSLGNPSINNQAIAYLSIGDARTIVNVAGSNWTQVVAYNGLWPTAAGPGIYGNTGTNDFSPITLGYYPLWGVEVLVHPENPATPGATISGQNLTYGQLGDQTTPGSFMGIFNAQSYLNGGVLTPGSVENEIELSKTGSPGATAIRLSDMSNERPAVGGTIFPPFE
ncbi:MAG: hypothetical protein ABSA45_01415 [Verrucomicrobiota bacterium]|jgi:hypothetical protein